MERAYVLESAVLLGRASSYETSTKVLGVYTNVFAAVKHFRALSDPKHYSLSITIYDGDTGGLLEEETHALVISLAKKKGG